MPMIGGDQPCWNYRGLWLVETIWRLWRVLDWHIHTPLSRRTYHYIPVYIIHHICIYHLTFAIYTTSSELYHASSTSKIFTDTEKAINIYCLIKCRLSAQIYLTLSLHLLTHCHTFPHLPTLTHTATNKHSHCPNTSSPNNPPTQCHSTRRTGTI